MSVLTTDDNSLQQIIHSHEHVVVSFVSPTCETCIILSPQYKLLATNKEYQDVVFVEVDAEQNPTIKKTVDFQDMPLIVTYHNGSIAQAHPVYDIEQITTMVHNLVHSHTNEEGLSCCGD